jgi:flagellar hook-basal body complex protein FliE
MNINRAISNDAGSFQMSENLLTGGIQSAKNAVKSAASGEESGGGGHENVGNLLQSFGDLLKTQMDHVNQAQNTADQAQQTYALGGKIELHNVMLAVEKADLSMQLAMQIRNKLVTAYQTLTQMSI